MVQKLPRSVARQQINRENKMVNTFFEQQSDIGVMYEENYVPMLL